MHWRTYFPFQVGQIRSAPNIISQGIVPRIVKNANTLERTLSSESFPHAVWISFTHLLCVKILIHPSHDRLLSCTPRVTLPFNWQLRGLFDFCHDRVKGLTLLVLFKWLIPLGQGRPCGSKPTLWKCPSPARFCKWFLLDPFSGRSHSGHDRLCPLACLEVARPPARGSALASWLCALWGWQEGAQGGGASFLGMGRPGLGAVPRPIARPWGVRPGPVTHCLWVWGVWAWGPVTNPRARALASWLSALWGRHEGAWGRKSLLPGCGS